MNKLIIRSTLLNEIIVFLNKFIFYNVPQSFTGGCISTAYTRDF